MDINLEDLENKPDERQLYWLLAIRAVRESSRLRTHNRTCPQERSTQCGSHCDAVRLLPLAYEEFLLGKLVWVAYNLYLIS